MQQFIVVSFDESDSDPKNIFIRYVFDQMKQNNDTGYVSFLVGCCFGDISCLIAFTFICLSTFTSKP